MLVLKCLFLAALSVVLIAFGWHPCCCGVACVSCSGLPTTLHGIIAIQDACCDLDGLTITVTWNGSTGWQFTDTALRCNDSIFSSVSRGFTLTCVSAGVMSLAISESTDSSAGRICSMGIGSYSQTSLTCPPSFQAVFSGTLSSGLGGHVCPCAGKTWTMTFTL